MNAGPELDRMVALKIFGEKQVTLWWPINVDGEVVLLFFHSREELEAVLPKLTEDGPFTIGSKTLDDRPYSTDIGHAWKVLEAISDRFAYVISSPWAHDTLWRVRVFDKRWAVVTERSGFSSRASTLAEAISKAALYAFAEAS